MRLANMIAAGLLAGTALDSAQCPNPGGAVETGARATARVEQNRDADVRQDSAAPSSRSDLDSRSPHVHHQ
jgi:hypothetical protein